MSEGSYPRAVVRKIGDQLVLDDSDAQAVFDAVAKRKCVNTFNLNADRIEHFKNRFKERGLKTDEAIIVVINVDDPNGTHLTDVLMPGYNWQEIRDRGETPFARGLATRNGVQSFLDIVDKEASTKLRDMKELAVVVVDYGVAEVFIA